MKPWVEEFSKLSALFLLPWFVYWDILKGRWISDDVQGIAIYDGKLQQPFLKWGNLFKWFRFHAGKIPNPDRDWKIKKLPPFVSDYKSHHRLNIWLFSGVSVLTYLFLRQIVGDRIALLSTLLWIVHPLGCQTVGWISGIGYVIAAFFMLVSLNLVLLFQSSNISPLVMFIIYGFFQWLSVEAQFATVGATVILIFMHQWSFAIISAIISAYGCFNTLNEAITLRKKVFHEQQMSDSTKFHPKKLIVVLKTLYYNVKLSFFPKRMGLYHTFCYHYELPYSEYEDKYFLFGLTTLLIGILAFILGSPPIKLGVTWFMAFVILFLNWITANQFVVDRYVWLPSLGVCLIVVCIAPTNLLLVLIGISLMRTWSHLPTYYDEEKFYLSNISNFENSEVALGNLGVVHSAKGMISAAMDDWFASISVNQDYDVPWYNLSSLFRIRGPVNPNYFPNFFSKVPQPILELCFQKDPNRSHLHIARYCLDKAVNSRTCHFPENWKRELQELDGLLANQSINQIPAKLISPVITSNLT